MEFPLLSLNPTNLDQIINKLEEKSYFRLQQTCRNVNDFIHNSPNISVHVNKKKLEISWDKKRDRCSFDMDIESLYGTRIYNIVCSYDVQWTKENMVRIRDILKSNRLTSFALCLPDIDGIEEEFEKLIRAVKAVKVELHIDSIVEFNRFEALLQSNALKEVALYLESREIADAACQLLPRLRKLELRDYTDDSCSGDLLRTYLQHLLSGPYLDLRKFSLQIWFGEDLFLEDEPICVEELKEILDYDELYIRNQQDGRDQVFLVKLPEHYPPISICLLRFHGKISLAELEYYYDYRKTSHIAPWETIYRYPSQHSLASLGR